MLSFFFKIKNKISLQVTYTCTNKKNYKCKKIEKGNAIGVRGACCFPFLKGSMTLETSLVLPLFLITMIVCMLFGESLIIRGKMHHGLLEAANVISSEQYHYQKQGKSLSISYAKILQKKYADVEWLSGAITINNISFVNSKIVNSQGEVELHMSYQMTVMNPFFGPKKTRITESIYKKAFTGYEPTAFELGNGYAYVTQYGSVYHTSIQCSHIMLKITESSDIQDYVNGKTKYKACSKCAKNCVGNEKQLFVAKEGDCYHTSLSCSGLTRMIQKVTIWEVEGMRECSRCAN